MANKSIFKPLIVIILGLTITYTNQTLSAQPPQTAKIININDNPANLDQLWKAYDASRDDRYLLKIIQYVNDNDFILIAAYEIVNRQYLCDISTKLGKPSDCLSNDDIIESIKKQYPNNSKQMIHKAVVVSAALWSLESNRHQDKTIDKKIKQIFDKNPDLDYWKKINKVL